jgi:hypothetical protein
MQTKTNWMFEILWYFWSSVFACCFEATILEGFLQKKKVATDKYSLQKETP